ncbi:DUF6348 family protein, partial [Kitasatospora sp. NPDC001574]
MRPQDRLAVIQRSVVREMGRLGQQFTVDGEVVRGPGTTAVAVREHPGGEGAGHVDLGYVLELGRADAPVVWDCTAGLGKTEEEKLDSAVRMWATTTASALVELREGGGRHGDHADHPELPGWHTVQGPAAVFGFGNERLAGWLAEHRVLPALAPALLPAPAEVYPVPTLPPPAADPVPREERAPVLDVTGLTKTFPLLKGTVFKRRIGSVYAVDGVDLSIREGETLGLVGESGSGKSTTLFELLRLAAPESGRIELLGRDAAGLSRAEAHRMRARLQIVFQDPMASLDPRMPVGDIVAEPLRAQRASGGEIAGRVPELLRQVGLDPAHAVRYPHQFSGGQRQRISIARALAVRPKLLVLDEPVSALDVSIQAGVLNLLQALKAELGLSYLFVSHDLSVIRHLADRVSVMYLGRTVEEGEVSAVFDRPRHPYTRALLSAVPLPDPAAERARARILLAGDPPSPTARRTGCAFRT